MPARFFRHGYLGFSLSCHNPSSNNSVPFHFETHFTATMRKDFSGTLQSKKMQLPYRLSGWKEPVTQLMDVVDFRNLRGKTQIDA
jgi:hypothetical protein